MFLLIHFLSLIYYTNLKLPVGINMYTFTHIIDYCREDSLFKTKVKMIKLGQTELWYLKNI